MTAATPPIPEDFFPGQILRVQGESWTLKVLDVRKGGCGVVYVVRDEKRSARWALKTFQSRFLWSDDDRKRFEREALIWLMFDRHPNIATARSLLRVEGRPCLWLEYCPHTLADALARGPLDIELVFLYAMQFCYGMEYAHRKTGIVHRDIKPSNCLLTENLNCLKVTDFGLARVFAGNAAQRSDLRGINPRIAPNLTTLAGTPQYMAPEQFDPRAVLDTRTDVYSFGVMFYQMLTADLPPAGPGACSHVSAYPDRHRFPEPLRRVVQRCVALDPRKRPRDFVAVREELEAGFAELTGKPWPFGTYPEPEMDATDWNDKAIGLENLGYFQEACTCFERALAIEASSAANWMNYGGCLMKMGRFEPALSCFDRGLEIDGRDAGLWSNKGVALESCGRAAEACACFERSLQLDPGNDEVWMNLGANYAEAGRLGEGVNCFDHSLEIDPRSFRAWSGKALALLMLNRYDEALGCCDEGIAIQPRDHMLWNRRAWALLHLGRLDDALVASNRSLEIQEDQYNWNTAGQILKRLGDLSEAERCFERARLLKSRAAPTEAS